MHSMLYFTLPIGLTAAKRIYLFGIVCHQIEHVCFDALNNIELDTIMLDISENVDSRGIVPTKLPR